MSHIAEKTELSAGTRARSSAGALLKAIILRIVRADAAYRQQVHLESLPDHILRDVGLDRDDVARTRRQLPSWWTP